jgi:hypothetical protein
MKRSGGKGFQGAQGQRGPTKVGAGVGNSAVVETGRAVSTLHTGQLVRVDGNTGVVTVL